MTSRSLGNRPYERGWAVGGLGHAVRTVLGVVASLAIVVHTLLIVPPLVVVSFRSQRAADALAFLWCRLVLWTSLVRVHAVGRERLPRSGSYILVANHQSYLDICSLVIALGACPQFVTKKELMRVPVFAQGVRATGQIVIDRQDPEGAKRVIDRAMRTLPGGVKVCFFAEGTRSTDGTVGPFKKGAVALALQTGLPLVPVSIQGTRQVMPKGSSIVYPGGRVRVTFGDPIPTVGVDSDQRDALTARVREAVIRGYDSPS